MKTYQEQLASARAWKAKNRDQQKVYMARYRREHRAKLLAQVSQWMKRNRKRINATKRARYLVVHGPPKPRIALTGAEYYAANRDRILSRQGASRAARINVVRAQGRKYYHKHRLKRIAGTKAYRLKNPEKIKASLRNWVVRNREHINNYSQHRRDTNLHVMLRYRLASRIIRLLKRQRLYKTNKTTVLLGIDLHGLKKYLESKFLPGMSWENRKLWHIDHIRPCSSFDLTIPEQQLQCFNYKNLQPLWAADNLRKSDNYTA